MNTNKNNDLNTIKQAAKIYKEQLLNKDMLLIYLENNKIEFYEVFFAQEHFKHLTGVKSNLNAYEFFYRASNNRLRISDFDYKDNTTTLKLNNLIKAMRISSYAKMFGRYKQNKIYLSLDKIAGNNNLMIGFDTEGKRNYPKTLLKGDIREYILEKPCRIVGIYIKKKGEKLYKECTYIAKNIKENKFLKNNQLKEKLMIK